MRALARVILFIFTLGLLAGLAMILGVFTTVPYFSNWVWSGISRFAWLPTAFSIVLLVCLAACVVALILLAAVPGRRKIFRTRHEMGTVEISRRSINSTVQHTLGTLPGLRRYSTEVLGAPRHGKVKLAIHAEPQAGVPLADLAQTIQARVSEELSASLGIQAGDIHVRLQPVEYRQADGRQRASAGVPRVI